MNAQRRSDEIVLITLDFKNNEIYEKMEQEKKY